MGRRTTRRSILLTCILVALAGGQSFAQSLLREQDEGTAKRNYGDPLPGDEDGGAPYTRGMSIIDAARAGGVAEARSAFLIGESVNSRTRRGAPALLVAAQAGNVAVLRFLLENGANPDLFEKSSGKTALIAAAESGDSSMIHLLLEHKANPNHQDRQGENALMKAARIGAADVVTQLLGSGLEVNATDYAGHGAVWHAQDARNPRIAKMIQAAGGT